MQVYDKKHDHFRFTLTILLKEQPTITIPRKQSLSSLPAGAPQASPRDATVASPRRGPGYTPTFDGILSSGESWVARRRASEASPKAGTGAGRDILGDHSNESKGIEIPEEEEDDAGNRKMQIPNDDIYPATASGDIESPIPGGQDPSAEMLNLSINNSSSAVGSHGSPSPLTGTIDYARIDWSYKDPSGQVQGRFHS